MSCDHCSSWWAAELQGRISPGIDLEVQKTIRAFAAPQQKRTVQGGYLAAAAVVILAAGMMIFTSDSRVVQRMENMAKESSAGVIGESLVQASEPDLILAEGFETITGTQTLKHATLVEIGGERARNDSLSSAKEENSEVIFSSGLELVGLEAWSEHS